MRRLLIVVMALMLAALPVASVVQTPASTYAAPAYAGQVTVTGRLVAAPQVTNFVATPNLLLQIGNRTMLVRVTGHTRFVNRDSIAISMSDLRNGANLRVTGFRFNRIQITATLVRDLSLPVVTPNTTQTIVVKAQLAAAPNATVPPSGTLCLSNAVVTNVTTARIQAQVASACAGGQLPTFLNSNTQIQDQNGAAASMAQLLAGDTLQITGSLVNGQFTASLVKDLSLQISAIISIKGQLAAAPSAITVPPSGILCLANSVVTGVSAPRVQAQVASPCPGGQLPIYLNSTTQIQDLNGAPATLANIHAGDNLQVTATLVNGQLMASLVKDLSAQVGVTPTIINGTIVAVPQATTAPASLLLQVGDQTILVQITSQTQVVSSNSVPIALSALQNGAMLQVTGTANGSTFTATLIRDLAL